MGNYRLGNPHFSLMSCSKSLFKHLFSLIYSIPYELHKVTLFHKCSSVVSLVNTLGLWMPFHFDILRIKNPTKHHRNDHRLSNFPACSPHLSTHPRPAALTSALWLGCDLRLWALAALITAEGGRRHGGNYSKPQQSAPFSKCQHRSGQDGLNTTQMSAWGPASQTKLPATSPLAAMFVALSK